MVIKGGMEFSLLLAYMLCNFKMLIGDKVEFDFDFFFFLLNLSRIRRKFCFRNFNCGCWKFLYF